MKNGRSLISLGIIALFMLNPITVLGEKSAGDKNSFSITPIIPTNQQEGVKGYFDLNMSNKKEQTLYIEIKNNSQEDVTYEVFVANGYTTQNGAIAYKKNDEENNGLTEEFKLTTYATVEESVEVSSQSSIKLPVSITLENQDERTILGAIMFKEKGKETLATSGNFQVKQEVNYGIAVKLNVGDAEKNQKLIVEFGETNVKFVPSGVQIEKEIINFNSYLLRGFKGSYQIKDGDNILFEGLINDFSMSPHTTTKYILNWDYETIENKEYALYMYLANEVDAFENESTFVVEKKELARYQSSEKRKKNTPTVLGGNEYHLVYIGLAVLFMFLMLWKKKKTRKDD